jgi:hypothetical protein
MVKKFAERRYKAEEYIDLAIKSLSIKDKEEKKMIKELKDIKQRIDNTIVYFIK